MKFNWKKIVEAIRTGLGIAKEVAEDASTIKQTVDEIKGKKPPTQQSQSK